MPVSRGRHGKLVDNFSPESDVTSLQDLKNNECPASSFPNLPASCRAVLVMRIQHRLSLFSSTLPPPPFPPPLPQTGYSDNLLYVCLCTCVCVCMSEGGKETQSDNWSIAVFLYLIIFSFIYTLTHPASWRKRDLRQVASSVLLGRLPEVLNKQNCNSPGLGREHVARSRSGLKPLRCRAPHSHTHRQRHGRHISSCTNAFTTRNRC